MAEGGIEAEKRKELTKSENWMLSFQNSSTVFCFGQQNI